MGDMTILRLTRCLQIVACFLLISSLVSTRAYSFVFVDVGGISVLIPPSATLRIKSMHVEIVPSWDIRSLNPQYEFYVYDSLTTQRAIQRSAISTLDFLSFQSDKGKQVGARVYVGGTTIDLPQSTFIPELSDFVTRDSVTASSTGLLPLPGEIDLTVSIGGYMRGANTCNQGIEEWVPIIGGSCFGTETQNNRGAWEFTSAQIKKIKDAVRKLSLVFWGPDIRSCVINRVNHAHTKVQVLNPTVSKWQMNQFLTQLDWHLANGFSLVTVYSGYNNTAANVLAHTNAGAIVYNGTEVNNYPNRTIGPPINTFFDFSENASFDWTHENIEIVLTAMGVSDTVNGLAGTIAHEMIHTIGYSHLESVEGSGTRDDPPYAVGDCIEEYLNAHAAMFPDPP